MEGCGQPQFPIFTNDTLAASLNSWITISVIIVSLYKVNCADVTSANDRISRLLNLGRSMHPTGVRAIS